MLTLPVVPGPRVYRIDLRTIDLPDLSYIYSNRETVLQGDMLDFDTYPARYCQTVETRGLLYWNPHAILDKKN